MIHLEQVALEFGDRVLFDDVTLSLSPKYRYVLVGANGAGKSSFLTLLSEQVEPTLGEISMAKSAKMGWMKQDHHLYDHLPLIEVVIKGREALWQALEEKHRLSWRSPPLDMKNQSGYPSLKRGSKNSMGIAQKPMQPAF